MSKKKKEKIRHFRNSDAQVFINKAKFAQRQQREVEQMERSFNREPNELDKMMDYAIAKDR